MPFVYGAVTHCDATFQNASTRHQLDNSLKEPVLPLQVPLPPAGNATGLSHRPGLGSSLFARRY